MSPSHSILLLFIFGSTLFADDLDMKKLKAMKARAIGPGGMSGRVTAIDVVLSNTDVIYVGTASGGLWRSESGGITRQTYAGPRHEPLSCIPPYTLYGQSIS